MAWSLLSPETMLTYSHLEHKEKTQWNSNQNTFISFMKIHLKISVKWRPFCSGHNVLKYMDCGALTWPCRKCPCRHRINIFVACSIPLVAVSNISVRHFRSDWWYREPPIGELIHLACQQRIQIWYIVCRRLTGPRWNGMSSSVSNMMLCKIHVWHIYIYIYIYRERETERHKSPTTPLFCLTAYSD